MAGKTLDEWRRELAPWTSALQSRLFVSLPALPTREQMEDLWILLEYRNGDDFAPAPWTKIIEALELMDLLVRVDADVGWDLLFSLTSSAGISTSSRSFRTFEKAMFPRHKLLPRYEFSWIENIEIAPFFQSVFLALRRMIGEDDQPYEAPSEGFARVKQLLLNAWKLQHGGLDFDRTREGRIVVKPHMMLTEDFQNQPVPFMMQHTLRLAEASRTLLPGATQAIQAGSGSRARRRHAAAIEQLRIRQRRAVFCFTAFDFELLECPVTNEVLYKLLQIAKQNLPIRQLTIDQVVMPQLHYSVAGSFFMQMLGVWGERNEGLESFEFACGRFDDQTVGAVCSALALGQTITKFALTKSNSHQLDDANNNEPRELDRSAWWPWLAYALFSADANNHIEDVKLVVSDLSMDNVNTMRAVLEHPHPLAYVCALDEPLPQSPVLSTPPKAVILKPDTSVAIGHRIQVAPVENFVDRGKANLTTNVPLQMVRDNADEGFVEIVFPGSGVSWIDRSDIQEIRDWERRDGHLVKHLELVSIGDDAREPVLELLRLVGGSLQSLTLHSYDGPFSDAYMTALSTICPRLRTLRIEGKVASLHWLVSPEATAVPRWSIERFELVASVVDHDSVLTFLQALRSDNHELVRTLRVLLYNDTCPDDGASAWHEKRATWCLEMLQKNSRLEMCEFVCRPDVETAVAFNEHLRSHNGERIFVPEQVAFLSVLTDPRRLGDQHGKHRKTEESGRVARYRLARETVDCILEMAGIPLRRICA